MNVSKLNRLVIVQRRATVRGAAGGLSVLWEDVMTLWAEVLDFSQKLTDLAQLSETFTNKTFVTRYAEGVDTTCRLVHEGERWNVIGVVEIGRREGLRIMTKKEVLP